MKKVLEDELMSLAHRILKLKNRAEIHELKEEAAVLYEKLSVLSFAEKHFEGVRPTIKKHDVVKAIESDYEEEHDGLNYPDGTEYNEDQIYEHNTEKIKDIVSQMPYETEQVDKMFDDSDAKTEEKPKEDATQKPKDDTPSKPRDDIQDFGVHYDDLPDFEPATDKPEEEVEDKADEDKNDKDTSEKPKDETVEKPEDKEKSNKPQRAMDLFSNSKKSLNDSLNKELKIGLNDRLSFVNQLFKGDTKAYESFIEHINALKSFDEVKTFLNEQIQHKYTFWKDKEDVANRLLYLIEKKFE